MKIKNAHHHDWQEVRSDDCPSEFASTTGLGALSRAVMPTPGPARTRTRYGFKSMIGFCLVLVALGAMAIARWAPLLRG